MEPRRTKNVICKEVVRKSGESRLIFLFQAKLFGNFSKFSLLTIDSCSRGPREERKMSSDAGLGSNLAIIGKFQADYCAKDNEKATKCH